MKPGLQSWAGGGKDVPFQRFQAICDYFCDVENDFITAAFALVLDSNPSIKTPQMAKIRLKHEQVQLRIREGRSKLNDETFFNRFSDTTPFHTN